MRSSMACVIEGQSSAFDALKALGRQAGNDLLLSCTLPVDRRVIEVLGRAAVAGFASMGSGMSVCSTRGRLQKASTRAPA
jgi:hypothetical protein